MMAPRFLGLDLGTSAVKALLVDADGEVLGRGRAEYPVLHPRPDHAEQDPAAWWHATVAATRAALAQADGAPITAIGLTGQMHGTVLLGEDGTPVVPAVIWPDQRSHRQVTAITAAVGAERLIELTGSPVATGFQAATLRWFREERPELWSRVCGVLPPKDWLRCRLTGTRATDPSDASGTLLLDVRRRDWSPPLLAAVGLDPTLLPPVLPSTAIAGGVRPDAAAALGSPPTSPSWSARGTQRPARSVPAPSARRPCC